MPFINDGGVHRRRAPIPPPSDHVVKEFYAANCFTGKFEGTILEYRPKPAKYRKTVPRGSRPKLPQTKTKSRSSNKESSSASGESAASSPFSSLKGILAKLALHRRSPAADNPRPQIHRVTSWTPTSPPVRRLDPVEAYLNGQDDLVPPADHVHIRHPPKVRRIVPGDTHLRQSLYGGRRWC
ncbi:hypothetical protein C8F01DRAFT_1346213 [Mycena amicta]|nr:hypothetical protein C8F01DRAFT_1346213 [Mycena amicta]